ncbi:MAG: right-handed parallel beta-helix repeat-containing protein, partial [Armatimonadota bacterium]
MSNSQPVPKTINVPADCTTIQEAIDAAIDGDTVVVAQGTYKECIDFIGKAITVRSSVPHMPETVAGTVIDGGGSGSVVTFASRERDTSVLMGFTLTHGGGTQLPDGTRVGGGIYCEGTSPTISNNRITDNESDKGGGLYCYQSAAVIAGNTIADNSARWGGGGVYCESSSPVISTNIVRGNKAETGNGGGIYCEGGSPAVATNTICDNRCDNAGGGVCCVQCSPTIAGNTIDRNTVADSGNGGGIFYTDAAVLPGVHVVTVVCNLITGNRGGDYGGG